jgi:hypothetical protein
LQACGLKTSALTVAPRLSRTSGLFEKQCPAALAQSAVTPPPPAQHVQPKALPVASLLVKPASTLLPSTVTHAGGTKLASGMELVAEEIKAAEGTGNVSYGETVGYKRAPDGVGGGLGGLTV